MLCIAHIEYNLLCTQCNIDQFEVQTLHSAHHQWVSWMQRSLSHDWPGGREGGRRVSTNFAPGQCGNQNQHKYTLYKYKKANIQNLTLRGCWVSTNPALGLSPSAPSSSSLQECQSCAWQIFWITQNQGKYFGLHKISANVLDSTKSGQIFWIAQHQCKCFG